MTLAELQEENAKLRREVARMRDARDRAEDLNGVMATRLANQGRGIAELKEELCKKN